MSRNWAFVIGINDYVPSNFAPLTCAKRDAEAMRDFFVEEAKFEGVWLFTDDSPGQELPNGDRISTQPTFGNLISLLEDRFNQPFLEKGDNCWFFFAGHGGQHLNQPYLMPQDANPRAVERTALSVNYIRQRLTKSGADNVILLLDACRTEGARDAGNLDVNEQPGIITVSSCGPTEKSWEIEALGHGAFTYALLEALRLSGERNCATVERLGQYLRDRVPQLCGQYGKSPEQRPRIGADPAEKLHFILQPSRATLADIALMKEDAYEAEVGGNLELAEQIWIRVIVVAQGRDMKALRALQRIEKLRAEDCFQQRQTQAVYEGKTTIAEDTYIIAQTSVPDPHVPQGSVQETRQNSFEINLKTFNFEVATISQITNSLVWESKEAEYFEEDLGDGIMLKMTKVPSGSFFMNEQLGEAETFLSYLNLLSIQQSNECKVSEFFLSSFTVTQAQYKAIMETNPSRFHHDSDPLPIEQISWKEAVLFCEKLSERTKHLYRLPKELEWEYACRAGTKTLFHCGDTLSTELANYNASQPGKAQIPLKTSKVGSFSPNAFGLYDMHGNVWEWCADSWSAKGQSLHVIRGGSWFNDAMQCRSGFRFHCSINSREPFVGFRVACTIPKRPYESIP